jgi:subtilisin family serine protease
MSLGRPLGGTENVTDLTPLHVAIKALYDVGIVIVASAGNNPALETTQQVPSGYNEVVAVAGSVVDPGQNSCPLALPLVPADAAAIFTSDGVYVPGVGGVTTSAPSEERNDWLLGSGSCFAAINGIQSTSLGGGFSRIIPIPGNPSEAAGTSFAAPHVAGVVARIIQTGMVSAAPPVDGAGVEDIRDHIRTTADRRAVSPPDPWVPPPAPLNTPIAPWVVLGSSPDGDFEGIAQAPR